MEAIMKPIITAFLNSFDKNDIQEIIQLAGELKIESLSLDSLHQVPIIEASKQEIKDFQLLLKEKKIKIGIIDPQLPSYHVDKDHKHKEALDYFKAIVKISDLLKNNFIYLSLPDFEDVIDQYDILEKRILDYLDYAVQYSKKLIIHPKPNVKVNVYAYILKKMKSPHLLFHFDPVIIMNNGDSTITAYRHMKEFIGSFVARDAKHDGNPELMGYGDANLTELLKKLSRDQYEGYFVIDNRHFKELIDYKPKKPNFFKNLFYNEQKKHDQQMTSLATKLFPNEQTRNVTYEDILKNQIHLIKLLFK